MHVDTLQEHQLTRQQASAVGRVLNWLQGESAAFEPYRLYGYAGTGKTTLARVIAGRAHDSGGRVVFGAYTGKAAEVLRRKGCTPTHTIHQMIYRPAGDNVTPELKLAQEKLRQERNSETPDEARLAELRAEVARLHKEAGGPSFVPSMADDSPLHGAGLVIIDECSMVEREMGRDLLDCGVPVLAMGDPFQLPPVRGVAYFSPDDPDTLLTEIHRQAEGSPVLALATAIRTGGMMPIGDRGDGSAVVPKGALKIDDVASFDQVLCGRNATRKTLNNLIRAALGRTGPVPVPGDRLVCLRNDHTRGLLNGSQWIVAECDEVNNDYVMLQIESSEGDAGGKCLAWRAPFEGDLVPQGSRRLDAQEFDYAYAMTVHKSQGSQWPRVLIIDESASFGSMARRWMYTGLTRASSSVVVVRG